MRFTSILIASLSLFVLASSATLVKVPAQAHSNLVARATPFADELVKSLQDFTKQSKAMEYNADHLDAGPGGRHTSGDRFAVVIRDMNHLIDGIEATSIQKSYAPAGQTKICDAYKTFSKEHTFLLTIIDRRADPTNPHAGSMRDVLKRDANALDKFGHKIINSVPVCQTEVKKSYAALEKRVNKAICAWTPLGEELSLADSKLCKL